MSHTYTWANQEQTSLKREDDQGNVAFLPTDPRNRDYAEFCNCGATAAPYVAPPAPKAETTEQKVNRLLSDYGLTRGELLTALEAKPAVQQAKEAKLPKLDTTGVDQLLPLDTQQLLNVAKDNNIMVEQQLLDPANHEALANYIAAAMNLKGQ